MRAGSLPATVDPIKLAGSGTRLTGELPVKAMGRLRVLCLDESGKVSISLRAEPSVILIRAQDRKDLIARDTGSLVVDGPILLSNIVEDELLLAMPMVPMHDIDECLAGEYRHRQEKPIPFSVLGELKHRD